jgi:hypothetical protein
MTPDEFIKACLDRARGEKKEVPRLTAYTQFNGAGGGIRIHAFVLEIDYAGNDKSQNLAARIAELGIKINSTFGTMIHHHSHAGTKSDSADTGLGILHNMIARPPNQSHIYRDISDTPRFTFLFLTNSDLIALQRKMGFGIDGFKI